MGGANADTGVLCVQVQANQTDDDYSCIATTSFTGSVTNIVASGTGTVQVYADFTGGSLSDCTASIVSSSGIPVWVWVLIGVVVVVIIVAIIAAIGGFLYMKKKKSSYQLYEDA